MASEELREPFGAEVMHRQLHDRLEEVRRGYADVMNRLWAGNGAGAAIAVSLIADAVHNGVRAPIWWLASPSAYILGLFTLGVGGVIRLLVLNEVVRDLEVASGVLDLHARNIKRPAHDVGLHWADARTVCGTIGTMMFMVGMGAGAAAMYQASFASR